MINEFHSENRKSPGADMAGRYAVSGRFFRVSEFVYFVEEDDKAKKVKNS